MIKMVNFWNLSVTENFCCSSYFSACEHNHCFVFLFVLYFLNIAEQSNVWTVGDCQIRNTEHFNLMKAFTSQGDLFVL